MKRSAKGNILLFMAAIIWGCALVAQKAGMSHLGPFGFTAIRCTLGGLVLLPLIWH
ncbi:MAG: EamA family transporter, partial [Firmicutes bacterium]|nr:EamA family transporter [Bacillota bacterium]